MSPCSLDFHPDRNDRICCRQFRLPLRHFFAEVGNKFWAQHILKLDLENKQILSYRHEDIKINKLNILSHRWMNLTNHSARLAACDLDLYSNVYLKIDKKSWHWFQFIFQCHPQKTRPKISAHRHWSLCTKCLRVNEMTDACSIIFHSSDDKCL